MTEKEIVWLVGSLALLWFATRSNASEIPPNEPLKIPVPQDMIGD